MTPNHGQGCITTKDFIIIMTDILIKLLQEVLTILVKGKPRPALELCGDGSIRATGVD